MDLGNIGFLAGNIKVKMLNIKTTEQPSLFFGYNSLLLKICLFFVFLLAMILRLNELRAPGHLLDREYTSAIFARAFYFTNNDSVEDWERDIAVAAKDQQPVLEPPVLDYLVSLIYRVMGREDLVYSRFLTSAFWLVSGFFMYLITKKLWSIDAAMIAMVYYLFVPMGIIISRSFQPDSLMMMLFMISLYMVVLYFERPDKKLLIAAAIFTGMTLLLRPLVVFAIYCAFLALSMCRHRNWKKAIDLPLIIFGIVSLLPPVIYYGYGILFAGFMRWKISTSFMPYLLVKTDFWLGWWSNVVNVVEFTPLFLSIIGFFLIKNKKVQALIVGLAVAFVLFSIAFTYHIHTHPYYHIQLFPIIGLGIAAITLEIIKLLKQSSGKFWWIPIIMVSVFSLITGYQEVRDRLYRVHAETPALSAEIGATINHSPHTVFVSFYYGLPLQYYGKFSGAPWPVRIDDPFYRPPDARELSVQERLDGLGFIPEYFVITNFDLYNRKHQDLKQYLETNCIAYAQSDNYLIYSNCQAGSSIDHYFSSSKLQYASAKRLPIIR